MVTTFTAMIDPGAGTITFDTGTTQRGLVPVTVEQDTIAGSGSANTVELVTTMTDNDVDGSGACGYLESFCGDVTIRSFYDHVLKNVFAEITSIVPVGTHDGKNSDPAQMGLSDTLGLWGYGTLGTNDSNDRLWVFGDSGTSYVVRGRVMADVVNLVINEVGTTLRATLGTDIVQVPALVEIYNPSSSDIDMAGMQLRAYGFDRVAETVEPVQLFTIPSITVPAGGHVLLRSRAFDDAEDGPGLVHLYDGDVIPHWETNGFVELVQDGLTVDFVRFGADTNTPLTASHWSGGAAPALPYGSSSDFDRSIARDATGTDTDDPADWTLRTYSTPGGANDIDASCTIDADADGIPDCGELFGSTFAGLPLYDWGARTGQPDIFIEIDYMEADGYNGTPDEGLIPRRESLEKIRSAFAAHGISVHFDVGDLFDAAAGLDPADHDLGGGGEVPFACRTTIPAAVAPPTGVASLYDYKAQYFNHARFRVFHYALVANSQNDVACGGFGASGLGERNGNDFLITMGRYGFHSGNQAALNFLINLQANTIMHELGHNLGLLHGGNENTNFKPNYISNMNYLYSYGLPTIGNNEGDRYYYEYQTECSASTLSIFDLVNPPTDDVSTFVLDYSDGSSAMLLEAAITEADGLGRAGSTGVDYNLNGTTTDLLSNLNANASHDASGTCPTALSDDDIHADFDDWSNLDLQFNHGFSGVRNGPIYFPDRQLPVPEDLPSPAFVRAVQAVNAR